MSASFRLPPRELQVAIGLARGESYREIAASLPRSHQTVKSQAKTVWAKMRGALAAVKATVPETESGRRLALRDLLNGKVIASDRALDSIDAALIQARSHKVHGSIAEGILLLRPVLEQTRSRILAGETRVPLLRNYFALLDETVGLHLYVEPEETIAQVTTRLIQDMQRLADDLDDDRLRAQILFRQLDSAHVSSELYGGTARRLARYMLPAIGYLGEEEALSASGLLAWVAAESGDGYAHAIHLKKIKKALDRGADESVSALSLAVGAQRAARSIGRISRFSDSRSGEGSVVDLLTLGYSWFSVYSPDRDHGAMHSRGGTELRFPRTMLELSKWKVLDLGGLELDYQRQMVQLSTAIGDRRTPRQVHEFLN